MAKSFLERVHPSRQRWKVIDWPFPVEGERPKVKLRVLGENEDEAAYLATVDYFKALKRTLKSDDSAFLARLHVEVTWRAWSARPEEMHEAEFVKDGRTGEPLTQTAEMLAAYPLPIIQELYFTYVQFKGDVAASPATEAQYEALIEQLKKNIPVDQLRDLPSSWLIGLITTLVNRLRSSTPANEPG